VSIPVNFEQLVKLPPAAGGGGYPYSIKAADLMRNFNYLEIEIDPDLEVAGIAFEIEAGQSGGPRKLKITAANAEWRKFETCDDGTVTVWCLKESSSS